MPSMSTAFRMSKSSVSNIIRDVCRAIWELLVPVVFFEPTEEKFRDIAEQFYRQWNFPNCVGAIDGKHVVIQVGFK